MDSVIYEWAREADLEHLERAFSGLPSVMYGAILGPCWRKGGPVHHYFPKPVSYTHLTLPTTPYV